MPKPPVTNATPADDIATTRERIDKLERAVDALTAAASTSGKAPILTLPKLRDVAKVLYKHPDEAPPHGCSLVFDTELEPTRYGGKWRPSGGAPVKIDGSGDFAVSGTGLLAISEQIVPSGWDDTQWVEVWVTAIAASTDLASPVLLDPDEVGVDIKAGAVWADTEVEIDGTGAEVEFVDNAAVTLVPASNLNIYEPSPVLTVTLTEAAGPSYNYARATGPTVGGFQVQTVSWLYSGGTPVVQASLDVDDATYPASHTLTLSVRYRPIPVPPPPP